jgi:preprotein translocase subunit SecE
MCNKKHSKQELVNSSFIVLVLFILLAIILGAVFI